MVEFSFNATRKKLSNSIPEELLLTTNYSNSYLGIMYACWLSVKVVYIAFINLAVAFDTPTH